uniref:Globin family profile domain-containing protein n=1 Tax=Romanomermis culicivorax TaxID=13658 RepID=A0A915I2Z8_ROMCU
MIDTAILKAQLAKLPINPENAAAFYQHAFTVAAETRKFFKGAENLAPEDVAKTKRFSRGGQRFIFSMHMVVHLANEDDLFDFYITDVMDRHTGFGLPPDIYDIPFHNVWYSFLEQKVGMSEVERREWEKIRYQKLLPAIRKNLKGWMGDA